MHWSHWWYLESARFIDIRTHVQGPASADGRTVLLGAPMAPTRAVVNGRVLPALLELVATERSDEIVSSALVAIGRLVDAEGAPSVRALSARAHSVLRSQLDHANVKVQESALLGLGLMGAPAAAADLVEIMTASPRGQQFIGTTSVSSRLRAFAAYSLGLSATRLPELGDRQRVALELIEVLEGETHGREDLPVAVLGSLGLVDLGTRMCVPAEDLRDRPFVDRALSTSTLTRYLHTWAMDPRGKEKGRSTRVRAHACVAYGRSASKLLGAGRANAVASLQDISSDRGTHVNVRTAATIGLGEVVSCGNEPADRGARRHLVNLVQQGQPLERRFALIAAAMAASRQGGGDDGLSGWSEMRKVLNRELAQARSSNLAWSALALGLLEDRLSKLDVDTGKVSANALTGMGIKRRSDDESAAIGLGLALATRGTDNAKNAGKRLMTEMSQTTTPYLRGHFSIALGLVGHKDAKELLREEIAEATNQPIRLWSAAVGLGLLGESVDVELLKALVETKSAQVRISLAAALGQTGTAKAVGPLLGYIAEKDRPMPMRASMIDSLAAICDLERLPWRDSFAHAMPYYAATPTLNGSGSGVLERPW